MNANFNHSFCSSTKGKQIFYTIPNVSFDNDILSYGAFNLFNKLGTLQDGDGKSYSFINENTLLIEQHLTLSREYIIIFNPVAPEMVYAIRVPEEESVTPQMFPEFYENLFNIFVPPIVEGDTVDIVYRTCGQME